VPDTLGVLDGETLGAPNDEPSSGWPLVCRSVTATGRSGFRNFNAETFSTVPPSGVPGTQQSFAVAVGGGRLVESRPAPLIVRPFPSMQTAS